MKGLTKSAAAMLDRDGCIGSGAPPTVCCHAVAAIMIVLSLGAAAAEAAVFRVGGGGAAPCTHATLAAAVAAAAANGPGLDHIYLTESVTLSATVDIDDQSVSIEGGYVGCGDDTPAGQTSVSMQANPGFWVHGGTSTRDVSLVDLLVIRSASGGRMLQIEDQSTVALDGTLLSSGAAGDGANVWMSGPGTILYLVESALYNGAAMGYGGGVYCEGGGAVLNVDGSITTNNAASGGGAYLDGCTLVSFGHISDNRADDAGGGVYAAGGSYVSITGSQIEPAYLQRNFADRGGALFLTGPGTEAFATDTWLTDNRGFHRGGAVLAELFATFSMDSANVRCGDNVCSLGRSNSSSIVGGVGGAIAATAGAEIDIKHTILTENHAQSTGSVVSAFGLFTKVTLESSVVHSSAGSLGTAYFDSSFGAELTVAFSTVVESVGCCGGLFATDSSSSVRLFSSILVANADGPAGGRIFHQTIMGGATRVADCILHDEASSTLPAPANPGSYAPIASLASLFADPAGHDFHLRPGAPAIDFCDTLFFTPTTTDIDRETRGYDTPPIGGTPFGTYDVGADEWPGLFGADFEEGDCSEWSGSSGAGC